LTNLNEFPKELTKTGLPTIDREIEASNNMRKECIAVHNRIVAEKDKEIERLREALDRISIPLACDCKNGVVLINEYDAWGKKELVDIINTKAEIAKQALAKE